jgi:hypothetical protein
MPRLPLPSLAVALVLTVACAAPVAAAPPTTRSVYVTVVDDNGQSVTGLTPADFDVRDGGKVGEIVSVEPATEKMQLALMVEEGLTAYAQVRLGMMEFVKRMSPLAQISFVVVTFRNHTIVDFTSDPDKLISGLAEFKLSQRVEAAQVPQAISDMAKAFEKSKPARPVMVLLAYEVEQDAGCEPEAILTELAKSGAQLSVVTTQVSAPQSLTITDLRDMAGRAQVIGDGPRQSGGRRIEVIVLSNFQRALAQIADDLSSQYRVTYALPGSARPSDRISVRLKKPGLTLRAPSRVPKK